MRYHGFGRKSNCDRQRLSRFFVVTLAHGHSEPSPGSTVPDNVSIWQQQHRQMSVCSHEPTRKLDGQGVCCELSDSISPLQQCFRTLGAPIDTAHGRSARCQAWFFHGSDFVGEEVVLAGLL